MISGTNGVVNVTLCQLDYEGDGIIDATATTLDGLKNYLTHVYTSNGLYYPTIKVTDSNGKVYKKSAVVNVNQPPSLPGKWNSMRSALIAGSIVEAGKYISQTTTAGYQNALSAIANAGKLQQFAESLGDVNIVKYMVNAAEGEMVGTRNGEERSFYILFVKDYDGIWRIKSF